VSGDTAPLEMHYHGQKEGHGGTKRGGVQDGVGTVTFLAQDL